MESSRYVTQFDSASCMLYALGYCLKGKSYAGEAGVSRLPPLAANVINALPGWLRKKIYIGSGMWEAIPPAQLKQVRAEAISRWVIEQYPERTYPAMMIGSSNGAAIHLCAALGIPWLPQTVLVAARRKMDPDELKDDLLWGKAHIGGLLEANPELQAHQMHDPLQDRLMVSRMAYFRLKRLRLGEEYQRFIQARLASGGTLILLECQYSWPVKRVGERHVFQVGGLGGIEALEYIRGSAQVEQFLQRQRSSRKRWDVTEPDTTMPEAEWGFLLPLNEDVIRVAREQRYSVRRLVFQHPEDLSTFVADFHAWWYDQHGPISPRRLLAECFGLVEPWWTLKSRCVPFWLAFNAEPSARALEHFLDSRLPFENIFLSLISNGVESIGLASMGRWRLLLNRAHTSGKVIGIHEAKYPLDIGSFISYDDELKAALQPYAIHQTPPASLADLERFLAQHGGQYPLTWG